MFIELTLSNKSWVLISVDSISHVTRCGKCTEVAINFRDGEYGFTYNVTESYEMVLCLIYEAEKKRKSIFKTEPTEFTERIKEKYENI